MLEIMVKVKLDGYEDATRHSGSLSLSQRGVTDDNDAAPRS
jgi:hypothetical protein